MIPHRALYAAFDRVPSAKGASIHIAHMVRALERAMGDALLVCAGDGVLPPLEREGGIEVLRLAGSGGHLVDRIAEWQHALSAVVAAQRGTLELCHFRDPWSGIPILDTGGGFPTVFEVNGLPSIEMPERRGERPRFAFRTPHSPGVAAFGALVTACGFNSMLEGAAYGARHFFLPLARTFDDQPLRAARRRRELRA